MKFLSILLLLYIPVAAQKTDSILLAKTTGKLPMPAYGQGQDRLGGAKMGYLDTGILLKITDTTDGLYRVELSKNHHVFLTKGEVEFDSTLTTKPFYLVNSWSLKGYKTYDVLSISMDEKLPYKSWMETSPSRIIIELYGVQSNTNWITQLQSAREVKTAYFTQVEDDVVRVTLELKHQQQWGYSIKYGGKNLSVTIRHQPPKLRLRKMHIGVDAGHGGTNTGASGLITKSLEKDLTLRFATQLNKRLERNGASVIMTRTTDTSIDNKDRVLWLQKQVPDLLVSLHLNSSARTTADGVSTYYKHIGFRPLSQALLNRMLKLKLSEFGNVGNFNFMLNAPTDFPNALVEIAFLSNESDEKKIIDPQFQKAVAKQLTRGLKNWLRNIRRSHN